MRTLCDACESAAAAVFCAADEAALCHSCDEKVGTYPPNSCHFLRQSSTLLVHMCNKLASRHVRVGLASPSDVPRCDICENAPAFFYCEVDGTSLCLHCDMIVHVGGKRTHERYLLLRQRVEFPGDKANCEGSAVPPPAELGDTRRGHPQNQNSMPMAGENHNNNSREPALCPPSANDADKLAKVDSKMIDLNTKPHRVHEQTPFNEQ